MREPARPGLKLLMLGAAPLLVATFGCELQQFGDGALLDSVGSGVSNAIARLAEALVLTLVL